jgi:hypothetical protein
MTDYEFEVLEFISLNQPVYWIEVINSFDPVNNATLCDSALNSLLKSEYIRLTSPVSGRRLSMIRLEPAGAHALLEEKDNHSDNRSMDCQQCETDVPKKRNVHFSAIFKGLRDIAGFFKTLLEIMRLFPF